MSRTSSAPTPRSFDEAAAILTGGRDKDSRKIANNTTLERLGPDAIAVRLHRTDVVVFYADGSVVFRTGGWNTSTTRARLNTYAPSHLSFFTRQRALYYVDLIDGGEPRRMTEGMRFDPRKLTIIPGRTESPLAS
jgi:hypothetical protein